jgi:hypothetical protein
MSTIEEALQAEQQGGFIWSRSACQSAWFASDTPRFGAG